MDAELTLPGDQWLDALKRLRKLTNVGRSAASDLVFEFDGADLKLTSSGVSVGLSGMGAGAGRAIVALKALDGLLLHARGYPGSEIHLTVEDGRLHVETLALSCRWESTAESVIRLPLSNITLLDILHLRNNHSWEAITASGLDRQVVDAEKRKATLIARAAEILDPLGVSVQDLNRFVTEEIKKPGPPNNRQQTEQP
jgi:hypothetical protein